MHKSFAHRRHENRKTKEITRIMGGAAEMLRPAYQMINKVFLNPWKDEDCYKVNLKQRMFKRVLKEQLDLVAFEEEQQAEWDAYWEAEAQWFEDNVYGKPEPTYDDDFAQWPNNHPEQCHCQYCDPSEWTHDKLLKYSILCMGGCGTTTNHESGHCFFCR